jgi:polysaccharide deacetylase family protein (PEP-CTERM system associated)
VINGKPSSGTLLLSFDIEEYFQVENLRPVFPPDRWGSVQGRVSIGVGRILAFLEEAGVTGTFFILGWVAERYPEVVRDIASRGHEIACHGYGHDLLTRLTPGEIRADLARSKAILQDVGGVSVKGYRAPNFSITPVLYDILREEGFEYDSSHFPFRFHDRYGAADEIPYRNVSGGILREERTGIYEIPISMLGTTVGRIPWGGGAYFRFIPSGLYNFGVRKILLESGYFIFYIHSWEFDPEQPVIRKGVRLSHKLRHYTGLQGVGKKFKALLNGGFRIRNLGDYLDEILRTDIGEHN